MKEVRAGMPFLVAVQLTMDKGWHTYWENPGDSGSPTEIHWKLPKGFSASPIFWPTPERIALEGGMVSYGYEHQALLLTRITPPNTLPPSGDYKISAKVSWVVCSNACTAGSGNVSANFKVSKGMPVADPAWSQPLREAQSELPRETSAVHCTVTRSKGDYVLTMVRRNDWGGDAAKAQFFPSDPSLLDHAAKQVVTVKGGTITLRLKPSGLSGKQPKRLAGIVVGPEHVFWADHATAISIDVPIGH